MVTYSSLFLLSMLFGKTNGIFIRFLRQRRLNNKVGSQNLLRALHELVERSGKEQVTIEDLLASRSWSATYLRRLIQRELRLGRLQSDGESYSLTTRGHEDARKIVRNHRLWELYLINYADIAPSHVDRDADRVEHILNDQVVGELENLLATEYPASNCPRCPHTEVAS